MTIYHCSVCDTVLTMQEITRTKKELESFDWSDPHSCSFNLTGSTFAIDPCPTCLDEEYIKGIEGVVRHVD